MRRPAVVVLALVGALAVGCGGLPLPAGVHVERTLSANGDDSGNGAVRVLPPLPAAGASPVQIVSGFLNAQVDSEDDYGIARQYLVPAATWSTAGAVTVYGAAAYPNAATTATPSPAASSARPTPPHVRVFGAPTAPPPGAAAHATVAVHLARSASIDAAGVYTPLADRVTDTYSLEQVAGEWRIATPPAGLQLRAADLQRAFVPSMLWWFGPDRSTLVPEVRWLPSVIAGRQTQLVRALLAGPSPALARAVRTAAPAGVTLDGSVSAAGSDIVVDLSPGAAALTAASARQLLVQLAATLRQSATGDFVRLEVDGQPLPSSRAPQRLSLDAAADHDVDDRLPTSPSVALVGGRLTGVAGGALTGSAAAALRGRALAVAVPAPFGGAIAAVERAGGTERVLVAADSGEIRRVGPAGRYGTPSWAADGTLVVPTAGGLLVELPGAAPVTVPVPGHPGEPTSVRIARDGIRLLVVADGTAYRSSLVRDPGPPSLGPLVPVSTGLGRVGSAVWTSASRLALLVRSPTGVPMLVQLQQDGALASQVPLPSAVGTAEVTLAGAAGSSLLVGGNGRIAQLTGDDTWQPLADGTALAAPG